MEKTALVFKAALACEGCTRGECGLKIFEKIPGIFLGYLKSRIRKSLPALALPLELTGFKNPQAILYSPFLMFHVISEFRMKLRPSKYHFINIKFKITFNVNIIILERPAMHRYQMYLLKTEIYKFKNKYNIFFQKVIIKCIKVHGIIPYWHQTFGLFHIVR